MASRQKSATSLHIALWVVQVGLAVSLVWAAGMKLVQPINQLAVMWPWTGQIPAPLVRLTGTVDLLGALGLTLPALLRIQPKLTPMAAIGIIVLMACASIFHVTRGEASVIGFNIVFAFLAAFIAWGRSTKAPITPK